MSFVDAIKSKMSGIVKQTIEQKFTQLKNFIMTMCISDIGISQDKENAPEVAAILSSGLYLDWQDDTHCSIGVYMPHVIQDKMKDLVSFCFHTGKQFVFG